MKSSTMLRKAQKHIAAGKTSYLCYGILHAAQTVGTVEALNKSCRLHTRIMAAIYPRASASWWLYDVLNPEQDFEEWRKAHMDDLREWRLRWLDALIAEYEGNGD